jgi:pimeloyl-ACP methyl ester carboxylesterase
VLAKVPSSRRRAHAGPLSLRLFRWIAREACRVGIPNRRWEMPPIDGIKPFSCTSREGHAIHGWCVRPERPRGTVIIVHGVTRNCTLDGIPRWGRLFMRAGFAAVAIDLRGHGKSDDGVVTFGVGEAADIRGAIDACAAHGLPSPCIVVGGSLGALAAQRAAIEDERIEAVVLLSMPAWPWQGIRRGGAAIAEIIAFEVTRNVPRLAGLLARMVFGLGCCARLIAVMINAAYGRDILADGDIRRLRVPPRTRVLAITGDVDTYDWRLTQLAWTRWDRGRGCRPLTTPAQAPDQDAWFLLARGHHHPPVVPHVLQWPRLKRALLEFLVVVAPLKALPQPIPARERTAFYQARARVAR